MDIWKRWTCCVMNKETAYVLLISDEDSIMGFSCLVDWDICLKNCVCVYICVCVCVCACVCV